MEIRHRRSEVMTQQASLSGSGCVFDILNCGVDPNAGIEFFEMILALLDGREEGGK